MKFKIGDIVRISETSQFSNQIPYADNEAGEIITFDKRDILPYVVQFPNGYINSYQEEDLILDKITNWKKELEVTK